MDEKAKEKLASLKNPKVERIIAEFEKRCNPSKITLLTGTPSDAEYVRKRALENHEEKTLKMRGHTLHYDGPFDQGRDNEVTRYLVPKGKALGHRFNMIDRDEGLNEVLSLLEGSMEGREMFVNFCCLCPPGSRFALPALQITDSAYVAHSENILYFHGFEEFKKLSGSGDFFYFVHSAGKLEGNVSADVKNKRIYIDLDENRVFSVNTQYAGNTVGLKKLSLRLAIKKAAQGGWLAEHMFLMGAKTIDGDAKFYIAGAFPSACGKTSTAMVPGQTILGDDIIYMKNVEGRAYAANVEAGIFGIIADVNPTDDPAIHKAITTPREIIFSNVLDADGVPWWPGCTPEMPESGMTYFGTWKKGQAGSDGRALLPAHKNARYTIRLSELEGLDEMALRPEGVEVRAIIYGGRDSHTSVPLCQSFSWEHGVLIGAALESETTSATIGKEGQIKHDPMANFDFLTLPLPRYIGRHLEFGASLSKPPAVFAVNYFLKRGGSGEYLNRKIDKKVWIYWMAGRLAGKYSAIKTPVGFIPKYDDLKSLFKRALSFDYKKEAYEEQFSIRADFLLAKLERIEAAYKKEEGTPQKLFDEIFAQRKRLLEAKEKHGSTIPPSAFEA